MPKDLHYRNSNGEILRCHIISDCDCNDQYWDWHIGTKPVSKRLLKLLNSAAYAMGAAMGEKVKSIKSAKARHSKKYGRIIRIKL